MERQNPKQKQKLKQRQNPEQKQKWRRRQTRQQNQQQKQQQQQRQKRPQKRRPPATFRRCPRTYVAVSLSLGLGVASEYQRFREIPESVEVAEGENVFLRCAVENQQGKAQWTKDGFALDEIQGNSHE
ncbi:headcase protein-like [Penaeus indicus]|uniref:headcase protein-like n=1 Tax=Penaeus indicus TaxID=29960 RepID=UPI00300C4AFE